MRNFFNYLFILLQFKLFYKFDRALIFVISIRWKSLFTLINFKLSKPNNDFLMEKAMNVVIFDDDEEPFNKQDLNKYTIASRNAKSSSAKDENLERNQSKSSESDKLYLISKQVSELESKVKRIQREGEIIRSQMQKKTSKDIESACSTGLNSKSIKQIEQIIMIVQKKIQLVIQQSKKLITKLNETVQRKINQLQHQQNNHSTKVQTGNQKNKNKLNQIQILLRNKVQELQNNYRNEYEKFVKETKKKQQAMMEKLTDLELNFTNKLNALSIKEKQYIDWIHHLEAKLKEKKTKKMITITQEKPQLTPIVNLLPTVNLPPFSQNLQKQNNVENIPSALVQNSKANCSIDQNNSKITRKHKIFSGKQKSPAPKNQNKLSPTKDLTIPQRGPNTSQNHFTNQNFYQQNSRASQNLNFYNDLKKQENKKIRGNTQRNQGWDKFVDMNDLSEQYTENESDDFFTPIDAQEMSRSYEKVLSSIPLDSHGGAYYGEAKNSHRDQKLYGCQDSSEKVFSPFDLN